MTAERKDHTPEKDSLADKHGFDNVMRGLLAVPPPDAGKTDKPKRKGRKPKRKA